MPPYRDGLYAIMRMDWQTPLVSPTLFAVLGILGLVLLQENVRVLEDSRAKQRLQEADQHYRLGVEAMQTERFEKAVLVTRAR